jgi:hypothetical protein
MSGYLNNIIAKSAGLEPVVQPRPVSMFEPVALDTAIGIERLVPILPSAEFPIDEEWTAAPMPVEIPVDPAAPQGTWIQEVSSTESLPVTPVADLAHREQLRQPRPQNHEGRLHPAAIQDLEVIETPKPQLMEPHQNSAVPDTDATKTVAAPRTQPSLQKARDDLQKSVAPPHVPAAQTVSVSARIIPLQVQEQRTEKSAKQPQFKPVLRPVAATQNIMPVAIQALDATPAVNPQRSVPSGFDAQKALTPPKKPISPTIQVTIGRIEVRAAVPPAPPERKQPSSRTTRLDEYLGRHHKGGRR